MGRPDDNKIKKAEDFISSKCKSRSTFPVLIKKFVGGVKKNNEYYIHPKNNIGKLLT